MSTFLKDEYCEAPEIPTFLPALQGWIDAERDYANFGVDDYPWYYSERPCVGFLAAGVWRSGGVALEEWAAEKGSEGGQWPGRCDLWAGCKDQYNFNIEAKHMASTATDPIETQLINIESKLARAAKEASTHNGRPESQLGVLFVAPVYPPGRQEDIRKHIATWLEGIYSIRHSAIAWIFRDRQELRPIEKDLLPGLVLIARTNK